MFYIQVCTMLRDVIPQCKKIQVFQIHFFFSMAYLDKLDVIYKEAPDKLCWVSDVMHLWRVWETFISGCGKFVPVSYQNQSKYIWCRSDYRSACEICWEYSKRVAQVSRRSTENSMHKLTANLLHAGSDTYRRESLCVFDYTLSFSCRQLYWMSTNNNSECVS